MRVKRIFSLFLAILMLLLMVSCGEQSVETTDGEGEQPSSEGNWRDEIRDSLPSDLKYEGETVTFLVRNNAPIYQYEISCEELLNEPLYDAIHYRNIDVESRLGLTIKSVGRPGSFEEYQSWNEILSVAVLTDTDDYDGASFYMSTGTALTKEGVFYNLMTLTKEEDGYFDFEKPWWNQSMVDELSVYGALFFAGGSLTITQSAGGVCVFFNRELFNEKYPDEGDASLYQMVRDQKWTIDQLTNYISNCWEDVNFDGVVSAGDVVGIKSLVNVTGKMDAWIPAMGLDFTKIDEYGEPYITLVNSRTVPAYEKVNRVYNNPGGFIPNTALPHEETSMPNGNVLFYVESLGYGAEMKASTVNYGVLPLPKYDQEQEDYRTCFENSASALAICSNVREDRAAMVSAVLELLSAESYKQVIPVYYETVLKGQYSKDAADAEMFDRILNSFVFSFGFAYSSRSMGNFGAIFRTLTAGYDLQQYIDSNKDYWDEQLAILLEALDRAS